MREGEARLGHFEGSPANSASDVATLTPSPLSDPGWQRRGGGGVVVLGGSKNGPKPEEDQQTRVVDQPSVFS